MASGDLSQGSGHRKFELSSLGMKITHFPIRVSLPKRAVSSKPTLGITRTVYFNGAILHERIAGQSNRNGSEGCREFDEV